MGMHYDLQSLVGLLAVGRFEVQLHHPSSGQRVDDLVPVVVQLLVVEAIELALDYIVAVEQLPSKGPYPTVVVAVAQVVVAVAVDELGVVAELRTYSDLILQVVGPVVGVVFGNLVVVVEPGSLAAVEEVVVDN